MFTQRILLEDEPDFNFKATVESHGWYQLPPFTYHRQHGVLSRVHQLADGRVVNLHVEQTGNTSRESFLLVQTEGRVFVTDQAEIDATVRHMLCLDWDMGAFYAYTRTLPDYAWVEERGAGRLLRAPTVWENLVKILLTTNTSWQQTVAMCRNLMALGDESAYGRAFPRAQQVAVLDVASLTAKVNAGYRGAYLHDLARRIVAKELNVEAWAHPEPGDLYPQIKALKGFGDYAAGSMLRLLGQHDNLSIDSVAREAFKSTYGWEPTDKAIRAHYAQHGKWRGLIAWMDVIRLDES